MNKSKVFLMRGTLHNTISNTKNCFRKKSFFPLCSKWYEWRYPNELVVFLWGENVNWIFTTIGTWFTDNNPVRRWKARILAKSSKNLHQWGMDLKTRKKVRGSTKWRFTSSPESNSDLKQNVAQIWLSFKVSVRLFLHTEYMKVILKIKFRKLGLNMWAIFFLWSNEICLGKMWV